MNSQEFNRWLAYHSDAHPAHADWLAKQKPSTLGHWSKALRWVEYDHAVQATDALLRGDLDEPKGFGGLPAAICRYAKTLAGRPSVPPKPVFAPDGQQVFVCPDCQDTGIRHVCDAQTIKAFTEGRLLDLPRNPSGGPHAATSCVVACVCEAGTGRLRMVNGVRFDPQEHLERLHCVPGIPPLWDRLAEFCSRPADERYRFEPTEALYAETF